MLYGWLIKTFSGVLGYVVAAVFAAALAGYATHHWDQNELQRVQLADANAETKAVQEKADFDEAQAKANITAALKEAHEQDALNVRTVTTIKEIPIYVTVIQDHAVCGLTVGLARVLRGAASQTDPGALILAAGQSDDDCSDVTPSEVAGWFTTYAGASQANAEQLNALIETTVQLARPADVR